MPVPDLAVQSKSERTIRELFKQEYSKTNSADRCAFAEQLVGQAKETVDDDIARYVLLREARNMATSGGDYALACRAIDAMADEYEVEPLWMKAQAIRAIAGNDPKSAPATVETLLKLADGAAAANNTELVGRLISQAESVAKTSKSGALAARVQAATKELHALQQQASEVDAAEKTLQESPNDPKANTIVGRYRCFVAGDWKEGIELLTRCDDADLKHAAQIDSMDPKDASHQADIGDAWWALSEKETGARARRQLQSRAAQWYSEAVKDARGLRRTVMQKRLASLDEANAQEVASKPQENGAPAFGGPETPPGSSITKDPLLGMPVEYRPKAGQTWDLYSLARANNWLRQNTRDRVVEASSLTLQNVPPSMSQDMDGPMIQISLKARFSYAGAPHELVISANIHDLDMIKRLKDAAGAEGIRVKGTVSLATIEHSGQQDIGKLGEFRIYYFMRDATISNLKSAPSKRQ